MTEQSWTFPAYKEGLPPGPWMDEPDKIQWVDPTTDLDCMMHRGPFGNWCGYVGVTKNHPYFETAYQNIEDEFAVHGGLTFAAKCAETDGPEGICHIPEPGRDGDVWWLGFDCGHAFDLSPKIKELIDSSAFDNETYRDVEYVKAQVTLLALQLKGAT